MSRSLYARLHRRFGSKLSGSDRYARSEQAQQQFREGLPSPILTDPEQFQPANGKRVAVVGAGFAGLCAGMQLASKGFSVNVFEANASRVGGRVWSRTDICDGRIIEAGAELIGANHHHWIELANSFALGFSVLTSEEQFGGSHLEVPVYLDGRLLPTEELETVYNLLRDILKIVGVDASGIQDADAPWKDGAMAHWDGVSVADRFIQLKVPHNPPVWQALELDLVNNHTRDLAEQSYLGLLAAVKGGSMDGNMMAYWDETEVYRCEMGNDYLAWMMKQAIDRTPDCGVNTNSPVAEISFRDADIVVRVGSERRYFDYVVLAVPPTVWNLITFSHPLPADAVIATGSAVKFLSPVSRRFWISDRRAPSGLSESIGMTWEGTDNQMVAPGQGIEVSVFAGGRFADRARQYKSDPQAYFGAGLGQMFPSYAGSVAKAGTFMVWPDEAWIKCGYACPTLGQVNTAGKRLNEVFRNQLVFAGEHTSMAYFGYMEGALQSGYLAAERVHAAVVGARAASSPT